MCSLSQTQSDLCTSGIGNVDDQIMLLKIIAQLSADLLVASDPAAEVSVSEILSRACDSGIGQVDDQTMLLKIIAQNTCELTP